MQDHPFRIVVDFEIAVGGDGDNRAAELGRAVDLQARRGIAHTDAHLARVVVNVVAIGGPERVSFRVGQGDADRAGIRHQHLCQ